MPVELAGVLAVVGSTRLAGDVPGVVVEPGVGSRVIAHMRLPAEDLVLVDHEVVDVSPVAVEVGWGRVPREPLRLRDVRGLGDPAGPVPDVVSWFECHFSRLSVYFRFIM